MGKTIRKLLFALFLGVPLFLCGRQKEGQYRMDSLLSALPKQQEDTNKVNLLNNLAYHNLDIDPDKSMEYAQTGLMLAEKLSFKAGIAASSFTIGKVYSIRGNPDEALKKETYALGIYQAAKDKEDMGKCILCIGNIQLKKDNLPEALRDCFEAMKLFEEANDKGGIASCYRNIGTVYNVMGNYTGAMKKYDTALSFATTAGDEEEQGLTLVSISNIEDLEKNAPEALKYAQRAFKIFQELNNKYDMALCDKALGYINTAMGNNDDALKNFSGAESILVASGDKFDLADIYGGIGVVYSNEKEYKKAEIYYNKALDIAIQVGSLSIIEAANQVLSQTYELAGDYKQSLETYKKYIVARDSIFNEENTKKTVRAQMQYDFDKKEAVARAEQAKKLQQKNILVFGIVAAFAVFLLIGMLLVRQTRLKAKHQQIELEQKQLRAQMNPHFIFNCLNSIQHFVVANDIKNANKYLSGFALLMRQTLENSKSGTITIRKELDYLKNYLSLEWMLFEDKFTFEIHCDEKIDLDSEEIPSMIIQPFIENAIRHGLCYLTDRAGRLEISFYLRQGYLFCEIDDNGIGREQSQKLKKGAELLHESQGMELTRQRLALVSKSNGSEYEIEVTDKKNASGLPQGTTITIKFPTNI